MVHGRNIFYYSFISGSVQRVSLNVANAPSPASYYASLRRVSSLCELPALNGKEAASKFVKIPASYFGCGFTKTSTASLEASNEEEEVVRKMSKMNLPTRFYVK